MHAYVRVCVCVCVCVRVCVSACLLPLFRRYFNFHVATTIVISFVQYFLDFNKLCFFVVKKLCSEVMALFTYCDVHWCYCSNILLDSRMTQPSAGP